MALTDSEKALLQSLILVALGAEPTAPPLLDELVARGLATNSPTGLTEEGWAQLQNLLSKLFEARPTPPARPGSSRPPGPR